MSGKWLDQVAEQVTDAPLRALLAELRRTSARPLAVDARSRVRHVLDEAFRAALPDPEPPHARRFQRLAGQHLPAALFPWLRQRVEQVRGSGIHHVLVELAAERGDSRDTPAGQQVYAALNRLLKPRRAPRPLPKSGRQRFRPKPATLADLCR